jgi:hypothetical protein
MGFRFDDGDGRDVCSLIITSGNDDAADNSIDWERFQQFLLTHMNQKTANDRLKTIKELYPTKQIGVLFDFLRDEYDKEEQQRQAAMSSSAAQK